MKKIFYNHNHMLKILIATSILMFVSIIVSGFTTPKIMGVGMLVWVVNLAWIMHLLTRGQWQRMNEYHDKETERSKAEGKLAVYGVRSVALPMAGLGMVFVVVGIASLFFI